MFKPQMKFQKTISIVFLLFSAVVFLYALGFMTDLYPLYLSRAYKIFDGQELFDEIQPYNELLVTFSLIVVFSSLLPYIFSTNKRRKYYLDNIVSSIIQALGYISCSITIIIGNVIWKNRFLTEVDFEEFELQVEKRGYFYSGTTIFFDLGFVIAAILLINAAIVIFNLFWKKKLVQTENAMLNGEKQDA